VRDCGGYPQPEFNDGERIERLVDAIAGYYTRALHGHKPVPRCLQAAWDVAADPELLIVQHLLWQQRSL
jgi:Family of unknown function (DUF5995)